MTPVAACLWCGAPAVKGRTSCTEHLYLEPQAGRVRVCSRCRTQPVVFGHRQCLTCLNEIADEAIARKIRKKNNQQCVGCGRDRDNPYFERCDYCRERLKQKRMALKREVLEAYGGCRCICCGEQRIEFLSLEHVNKDGARHRRSLDSRGHKVGGHRFYLKLKKLGFPQDPVMVVYCLNCNIASAYGLCPHELERRAAAEIQLTMDLDALPMADVDFDAQEDPDGPPEASPDSRPPAVGD